MNIPESIFKSVSRFGLIASIGAASMAALSLSAAAPTAGTPIGNQASATYQDQNGTDRSTTSNTVITTVLQIPGLALTQDNTRTVSPGGSVFFPHTLTNTGNGTDSFDLLANNPAGDFTLGSLTIYADTDRDGQPDDLTSPILTTGDLTPGESFYFVVGTSVPGGANDGDSATFDINGTSDLSETAGFTVLTETNTDTVNVSLNAVITVTKLIDQAEGVPGTTPITYTLEYNNTGNAEATDVTLTDVIPANLTYVDDSGRSSLTGATVLTDDTGDAAQAGGGTTVDYQFDAAAGSQGTLTVIIASVPAGASGFVTFQVGVDDAIAPQVIFNEVQYTYDPDGPGTEGPITPITTNRPPFEVLPEPDVTVGDDTVATAVPGETVTFTNVLTNNGNVEDTFDMTFVAGTSTYPAGTTFLFFQEDGNTPMVDTNGNSIPDTGPVAGFGGTYNVVVKATLPTNIPGLVTPNGPYAVTKRATGTSLDVNGNPATDDGTDTLTTITPPSVDITNAAAAADPDGNAGEGDGAGASGLAYTTDPGTTLIIPLTVENEGSITDDYNLTVDPASLPAGWVVNIREVAGGAIVNTSGALVPPSGADGGFYNYIAEVIVPDGQAPGSSPLTFVATSPTTGSTDSIVNTVTVNTVREISLTTDNAGSVSPGGSIDYVHVLTNLGNVTEAEVATSISLGLSDTASAQGWTSVAYLDVNNNGILEPGTDEVITSLPETGVVFPSLGSAGSATDSARIFVRVFAPLGAPNGAINITTITATPSGLISGVAAPSAVSNDDTTTVVLGDILLVKEQALDANGDGLADGPFTTTPLEANPGESILYQITATNTGSADATDVLIFDTTPSATVYEDNGNLASAAISGDGTVNTFTGPSSGASGSFEFDIGTLAPGDSAVVNFGVTIDE